MKKLARSAIISVIHIWWHIIGVGCLYDDTIENESSDMITNGLYWVLTKIGKEG
jgi:hypothetical protein